MKLCFFFNTYLYESIKTHFLLTLSGDRLHRGQAPFSKSGRITKNFQFGCQNWLPRLVFKNGCQEWLSRLVSKIGCQGCLSRLVVKIGCQYWFSLHQLAQLFCQFLIFLFYNCSFWLWTNGTKLITTSPWSYQTGKFLHHQGVLIIFQNLAARTI